MTLTEDELRAVLRAEAAAHRPDRVAILDRITQTAMRNGGAGGRAPRIRIAGAAAAVAAVLGGGGFAQWALAGGPGDDRPVPPPPPVTTSVGPAVTESASPAASASPSRAPSSPAGRSPGARRSSRSGSPPATTTSTATNPAAEPARTASLWSDGSVDVGGDTQASSVVTLRTTEKLTALQVTIRVARTAGLTSRGSSQQVPGASVDSSVTEEGDVLVHHFTLSSGDTLDPGTYTFFARYTYPAGGRDAGADRYSATATGGSGATLSASGAFG
ncbi:hypothetical protein [Actinoplanes teichomyceticus]|uniref:Uncharacterized protein n=1 Tax=Actinoplanes teichomyceticus TaxID=1867 RepID=A0A561WRZ9_ACTTI|nr:hypothetical protein [Actinoplanes teichomyceticus]TWG26632.1 hypothetical protein FHX34_1011628 [Actinoplanes teichomyceticus]GIF15033.1 hypothetical protein Ate01nite_50650 [Actinoplanes teichomyceticus]